MKYLGIFVFIVIVTTGLVLCLGEVNEDLTVKEWWSTLIITKSVGIAFLVLAYQWIKYAYKLRASNGAG